MLLEADKKKKGSMVVAKKKIQSSKLIPNEEEIKDMIKKSGGLWKRVKGELQSVQQEDAFLRAIGGHLKIQVNQLYYKKATILAEEIISEKASDSYYQFKKRPAPTTKQVSGQIGQSLKQMEISSPSELNSQIEKDIHLLQQAKKVLDFMQKKKEIVGEEKKFQMLTKIEQFLRERYLFKLLNELTLFQAIHSKIKLETLTGLSKLESGPPFILNETDRLTVQKQFPTQHTREVLKQLEIIANDGGLVLFLDFLKEELCNLAVSVRLLDKKSEKAMVAAQKSFLKSQLDIEDKSMKDAFEEQELKEDEEQMDSENLKTKLGRCAQLYSLTKDGLWLRWLLEGDKGIIASWKLEICKELLKMSTIAKEGSEGFKLKQELVGLFQAALLKVELDMSVKQDISSLVKSFVARLGKY